MFLFQALLVVSFVYWFAGVTAEVIFTSDQERRLPALIKSALGLLLITTYFSAAWQLMSMRQSWVLGLLLLALYGVGNLPRIAAANGRIELKKCLIAHVRGYAACLSGTLLFFAPLFIAHNYGPFTEGGGDVTIYSDTAKLLTDHDMTSFGQVSPDFRNAGANIKALLNYKVDSRYVRYAYAKDEFVKHYGKNLNPPIADVAAYRTVADIFFSSIFYAPYAQFYFLSKTTNYPVYYGVQAFCYAFMLAAMWYFFRRLGLAAAAIAVAGTAASHGLISVFYNTYSMQAISLSISALVLYLVLATRIFSFAGLRAFGFATLIVWLSYTHYVSILAPLLFAAAIAFFVSPELHGAHGSGVKLSIPRHVLKLLPSLVFAVLVALLIVGGSGKAIEFVTGLVKTFLQGTKNVYLGDRISPFSLEWLGFLFGFISQQHLQPFAIEIPWVMKVIGVGIVLGVASALLGGAAMVKAAVLPGPRAPGEGLRFYFVVYGLLVLTVAMHIYMAQSSLYTQAKGAQNILIVLYAALVLPFAVAFRFRHRDVAMRNIVRALGVSLVLLICTLLIPRAVYTLKLVHGQDRSTILEASYFEEARRIREVDPDAFVLFEPRKSADLYVSIQPFAGSRMVPRRHQSLERVIPFGAKTRIIASDLIQSEADVPHLWTLSPVKEAGDRYVWKAQRMAGLGQPTLFLFGDDYERDFGERPRSADAADGGMFSYLRNGSAMLYLPAGQVRTVEVKISPREPEGFGAMLEEIRHRLAEGEFPESARLQDDGKFVTLSYQLQETAAPRVVTLARFSAEYWFNVRLNGEELAPKLHVAAKDAGGTEKALPATAAKPSKVRHYRAASWQAMASSPPIVPAQQQTK